MSRRLTMAALGALIAALSASHVAATEYLQVGRALVRIHVSGILKEPREGTRDYKDDATGFIVSPDGLVFSAGHIVPSPDLFQDGEYTIKAWLPREDDGAIAADGSALDVEIIKASASPTDFAVLQLKSPPKNLAYLWLCERYRSNESFDVFGYPGGYTYLAWTPGRVSTPGSATRPIVLTTPANPGDSGAPVVNEKGGVFGIVMGQLIVDNRNLVDKINALGVPMALRDFQPIQTNLRGVVLSADCSTPPVAPVTREMTLSSKVSLSSTQRVASATGSLAAPAGYRIKQVLTTRQNTGSLYISPEKVSAQVSAKGDLVTVESSASIDALGAAPFQFDTQLDTVVRLLLDPENVATPVVPVATGTGGVRAFPVARTLRSGPPQQFRDQIPAPSGFIFKSVMGVRLLVSEHSTSEGVHTKISEDGRMLEAAYALSPPPDASSPARVEALIDAVLAPASRR